MPTATINADSKITREFDIDVCCNVNFNRAVKFDHEGMRRARVRVTLTIGTLNDGWNVQRSNCHSET